MSQQLQTVLQVLTFLGAVALVGIGALAAVAFTLARRPGIATVAAAGAAAVAVAYGAALLVLGAASHQRVLGPGATKVFCEIDCHLAYRVTRVRTLSRLPDGARSARGRYYLVTLRTTFDERTISPRRGDGALWPNPRRARLVDARGRAWDVDAAATAALGTAAGTAIETPLHPGESYETTLAFDLPADVAMPRLELTEAAAVTRLLLGHENSPFHAKTLLALGAS